MLTWLVEKLPWHWRDRLGEFLWGGGYHDYLCPCGGTP